MVRALADSAAVLRRAFRPLLVFEATIGLATIIVLDPLLLLLLDRIVALGGDPFVGNSALIAFALSLPGLMAVAVATVAATFVAVATFGGVSLILWGAQRVQPPRHLPVWASLLARVPALLAISAWAVGAAVLLALPILGTTLIAWRWLLSGGDFYFYFTTRPPEFIWAAGAVAVAAAMAAIRGLLLLLRTGLAVPICLTQPVGARQALRLAARQHAGGSSR